MTLEQYCRELAERARWEAGQRILAAMYIHGPRSFHWDIAPGYTPPTPVPKPPAYIDLGVTVPSGVPGIVLPVGCFITPTFDIYCYYGIGYGTPGASAVIGIGSPSPGTYWQCAVSPSGGLGGGIGGPLTTGGGAASICPPTFVEIGLSTTGGSATIYNVETIYGPIDPNELDD
jgi:hypothetical protein